MKTKKKNRFLTFCFSFMPGAAEMYMGFMKTGVSLMLLFCLIIALSAWIQQAVLTMFGVVIWFYGFFHANHLAGLNDAEFDQVKDEYLFGMDSLPGAKVIMEEHHRIIAGILIFIGICCLWSSLVNLMYDLLPQSYQFIAKSMSKIGSYVPSVVIGVGIIILGVRMISGKKILTDDWERPAEDQRIEAEEKENRKSDGKEGE